MTTKLKAAVKEIVSQFDKKYGTETDEVDFLYVYFCADMYISLNEIIFALENDLNFEILCSWYWFNLEHMRINLKTYWRRLQDMPEKSDIRDYHIYLLTERVNSNEKI